MLDLPVAFGVRKGNPDDCEGFPQRIDVARDCSGRHFELGGQFFGCDVSVGHQFRKDVLDSQRALARGDIRGDILSIAIVK